MLKQSPGRGLALSLFLTCVAPCAPASELPTDGFTALSWNAEGTFDSMREEFRLVVQYANPHILLLDEAPATSTVQQVQRALEGLHEADGATWHVDVGPSGGRQRGIVASIAPLQGLPEFSRVVPYPEADRQRILNAAPPEMQDRLSANLDAGVPVNGVMVLDGGRRLFVVITDLACCGDGPQSWQELRRRVEANIIRTSVRQVLSREKVDGLIIAGDFNLVARALPLIILSGPYPGANPGLIGAELYHFDNVNDWTWDGRDTPYPSSALDYQLYGPGTLELRSGFVFDSEHLPPAVLRDFGLDEDVSRRLSRHRPLVATYRWR